MARTTSVKWSILRLVPTMPIERDLQISYALISSWENLNPLGDKDFQLSDYNQTGDLKEKGAYMQARPPPLNVILPKKTKKSVSRFPFSG